MSRSKKIIAAAIVSIIIKRRRERRMKRLWVRQWIDRRHLENSANSLINELRNQDVNEFRNFLRMSPIQFDLLLQKVSPIVSKQDTCMRKAIPAATRLIITLRYLITGDSFRSLMYFFRVPHNTISSIIPETCRAIHSVLCDEHLKVRKSMNQCTHLCICYCFSFNSQLPTTRQEWIRIADEFYSKWNFPNCLGALDGKHVVIRCPYRSGSMFFNYKHTFSVVLMALAAADYSIIYFDVGCNGRISDGGVFNQSSLCHAIERNVLNIPLSSQLPGTNIEVPYVIVADDAFALKDYLLKPFAFRNQDRSEQIFNYRLSRARRVVENVFGILSARFRFLRKTIELSEKNCKMCVLAVCALHNWLLSDDKNAYLNPPGDSNIETDGQENVPGENHEAIQNMNRNSSADAKRIREIFKDYFVSPEGEVEWQNDMI